MKQLRVCELIELLKEADQDAFVEIDIPEGRDSRSVKVEGIGTWVPGFVSIDWSWQ